MFKFFRQIRFKLMNQNKSSKYFKYALGEIILVVIGILIALQINNWNEKQKNIDKEQYYLESILKSIETSQNELDRVINDSKITSIYSKRLLDYITFPERDNISAKTLDSLIFNSFDYSLISLNDGAIQEILSTGNLDLIKNEEVRLFIASWDKLIHSIRKHESYSEDLSLQYQNYIYDFIDIKRKNRDIALCILIPERKQAFIDDARISNYLDAISRTQSGMNQRYIGLRNELNTLKKMIENYNKDG